MKFLFVILFFLLFSCSFSIVLLLHFFSHSNATRSKQFYINRNPAKCKENEIIDKLLANYSSEWKKQENNIKPYRSLLASKCNAVFKAVITQQNTPLGKIITNDVDGKKMVVESSLFNVFPQESPFKNAPWDSCSVVGNGGIIANSNCGKQIDSASYVIRCNLPPLSKRYENDTGIKTSLVTANPSIFFRKYHGLNKRHQKSFLKNMQLYGDALFLLNAFSYRQHTAVSMRAFHLLQGLNDSAVFFNPWYLKNLSIFWRGHKIRERRLSTGLMMSSLALELCNNVHLYGFWPFGTHPYTQQNLTNHYYDNIKENKRAHAMPSEFKALLNLHNKGVIHLHLGECTE